MPEPSRRPKRVKFDTTPIATEDIFNAPALGHLVSFLTNIPPERAASYTGESIDDLPSLRRLKAEGEASMSTVLTESPVLIESTVPIVTTVPNESTVSIEDTVLTESTVLAKPLLKLRPLRTASDGHSAAEQSMYDTLWDSAEPLDQGDRIRKITIGYERAGQLLGINKTGAKRLIAALTAKFSIEMTARQNSDERIGREYLIHSPTAITLRRREAGYTHFSRNRGGVTLERTGAL
jgi:hypothetical protein